VTRELEPDLDPADLPTARGRKPDCEPVDPESIDVVTAPWRQLSSRSVYANRWIEVVEDVVRLPNGHETIYGVVRCGDCVGVLPFVDDEHVILVQQYRYVAGRPTWEMPTGGVHPGETLAAAAQRELAEEAGQACQELVGISTYHTSKSVVDETAHLFVARHLTPTTARPDATELVRTRVWPLADVTAMVLNGHITDSMTVIAVLTAEHHRTRGTLWGAA
jgi:8-oxo-dGTP pyrophosphatase MutT (NUDIX family)